MASKAKKKPYDPLAPSYKTQQGFNKAVRLGAKQQIAPQLQDVRQRRNEAAGAHTTRQNELTGWYGSQQTALDAAHTRLQDSLKTLLATSGQFENGGTDALSAAIRKTNDSNSAAAAQLGVASPDTDPNYVKATAAMAGADQLGLAGQMAGELGRSAAQIGIGGIAGRQAGENEQRRFATVDDALTKERTGLRAQLPALRAQLRQQLGQAELGKAGQAFQQNLAQDQFGLSKAQFGETKKQNRFQQKLATDTLAEQHRAATVGEKQARINERHSYAINQAQVKTQNKQLNADIKNAKTTGDKELAKARAERFNKGVDILTNFINVQPQDIVKNGNGGTNNKATQNNIDNRMRGQYGAVMQRIMAVTGMGPLEATEVMMTSTNAGWAKNARHEYARIKARRRAKKLNPTGKLPSDLPTLTTHMP